MSDFWLGVVSVFGFMGATVVALVVIWMIAILLPEITWWTVKKIPMQPHYRRNRMTAVVASARRGYVLRIPQGIRIVLVLGADKARMTQVEDLLNEDDHKRGEED